MRMKVFDAENWIKKPLSFHIFKATTHEEEDLHVHDFVEIIYIIEGSGKEKIGDSSYTVRRGDLLFVGYGETHSFLPDESLTYYNICLLPEILFERITSRKEAIDLLSLAALEGLCRKETQIGLLHFEGEERFDIEFIFRSLYEEYTSTLAERQAVLESYITILIAKIIRRGKLLKQRTDFCEVWRVISAFIDENLGQKITLSEVANKYFYNSSYFSRMFKKKFGVSFMDYLARERVNLAKKLLSTTNDSIEISAESCGFGDRSSMYRAFEKYCGCTPTQYRTDKK